MDSEIVMEGESAVVGKSMLGSADVVVVARAWRKRCESWEREDSELRASVENEERVSRAGVESG